MLYNALRFPGEYQALSLVDETAITFSFQNSLYFTLPISSQIRPYFYYYIMATFAYKAHLAAAHGVSLLAMRC